MTIKVLYIHIDKLLYFQHVQKDKIQSACAYGQSDDSLAFLRVHAINTGQYSRTSVARTLIAHSHGCLQLVLESLREKSAYIILFEII